MGRLYGRRSGATYDPEQDEVRLNRQAADVWQYMRNGQWRTLRDISRATGHPEASVSARLRDYRKYRFGSHSVERVRTDSGIFWYRLVPNTEVRVKAA